MAASRQSHGTYDHLETPRQSGLSCWNRVRTPNPASMRHSDIRPVLGQQFHGAVALQVRLARVIGAEHETVRRCVIPSDTASISIRHGSGRTQGRVSDAIGCPILRFHLLMLRST